jgi:hypothetical protein
MPPSAAAASALASLTAASANSATRLAAAIASMLGGPPEVSPGATSFSACLGSGRSSRCTEPTRNTSPNGTPLHLLPILSRPTQNRDRGTQGRGLHHHPRMAPAAPASLTSSPIDRTARNTAELDGRNTEDRTLALSGPRQRNAFSIHAPSSPDPQTRGRAQPPMGVSPGQTSRAHSLCRDHYQARLSCAPGAHQS